MKYKLNLQGSHPNDRLRFEIDLDTGTISGEDAKRARLYLDNPSGKWTIYGTQTVSAPDPLHNPRDLAVAFEEYWESLPQELVDLLPPVDEIPEGAIA